ncbi:MAG: phytanoyl-CoA dioxygenase family protein [Armatimonadota bacterium]|nr:phytanoyl-CoA dioxygenase family protein [Armatimonadota bacterium]
MINVNDYKENGFILLKGFFQGHEMDVIRNEAKEVFLLQLLRHGLAQSGDLEQISEREFETSLYRLFEDDLPAFVNSGKQIQHLISLHRLALDERVVGVLKQLGLEFPNICTRPIMYFNTRHLAKKEVFWRLAVHQDWRSMQGSLDSVVLWIPLVDVDKALGALEVIPGSHREGLLSADLIDGYGHLKQEIDLSNAVTMEME